MSEATEAKTTALPGRLTMTGIILAVAGAIVLFAGLATLDGGASNLGPTLLYGAMPWALLTFGCYGLKLLFHITRGRWGTPIVSVFESGSNAIMLTLWLVVFLVIAWAFGGEVYSMWWNGPIDDIVGRKSHFLNRNAFTGLMVVYFGLLMGVGYMLNNFHKKELATGEKSWSDKRNNLAAPGMVMFFIVMTFMLTHVLMSVDAHWYSTIWGVWLVTGGALGALALSVILIVSNRDKAPFKGHVDDLMKRDFGNLMLTLTMLWGYFSFSQMLIIWSGNLKEFIPFYLDRLQGGFSWVGGALIIGAFLIPFLLMLSPGVKRNPISLIVAACFIFLMRFVDVHWIVGPFFRDGAMPVVADLGGLLLFGGIWFLIFGFNMAGNKKALYTPSHPYQMKEVAENV